MSCYGPYYNMFFHHMSVLTMKKIFLLSIQSMHTHFIQDRRSVNITLTKAIVMSMLAKLLLRGKSILKAKMFKGKCKVKLEYPEGQGIQSMRDCRAVSQSRGPGISPGYFERRFWLVSQENREKNRTKRNPQLFDSLPTCCTCIYLTT